MWELILDLGWGSGRVSISLWLRLTLAPLPRSALGGGPPLPVMHPFDFPHALKTQTKEPDRL